jgi:hypothetical protein
VAAGDAEAGFGKTFGHGVDMMAGDGTHSLPNCLTVSLKRS